MTAPAVSAARVPHGTRPATPADARWLHLLAVGDRVCVDERSQADPDWLERVAAHLSALAAEARSTS